MRWWIVVLITATLDAVIKQFSPVLQLNTGISFGIGREGWSMLLVTSLILIGTLWYLRPWQHQHVRYQLASGLVLGGSLGNLSDRVFFGGVRDIWPSRQDN